eukprot:TRINITY_DN28170_c0_g1_i1.p1 TRINITY_DN28170_c0_g1~~TRINITY_DN28170_c0_g1_i1.p1  ORF type:complete len:254 (-),score=37.51 TRINITY_DN28170_c0_g1_i1:82-774(-)
MGCSNSVGNAADPQGCCAAGVNKELRRLRSSGPLRQASGSLRRFASGLSSKVGGKSMEESQSQQSLADSFDGQVAIHVAARKGDAALVERYLKSGADVNVPTGSGVTPLMFASTEGHAPVVPVLLAARARLDCAASDGDTALHLASGAGCIEVVQLLLRARAPVDARNKTGNTPLHEAARRSKMPVALTLLEGGAELNARNGYGYTPFTMAEDWGSEDIRRALAAKGGHR